MSFSEYILYDYWKLVVVDFKHEREHRQKIYVIQWQYFGFDKTWGRWSPIFLIVD